VNSRIHIKHGCAVAMAVVCMGILSSCAPKHKVEVGGHTDRIYATFPGAQKVVFRASIDNFQPHPAQLESDERWVVVVPRKSEFTYFYLVDSVPTIPDCTETVMDDFGGKNCFFSEQM